MDHDKYVQKFIRQNKREFVRYQQSYSKRNISPTNVDNYENLKSTFFNDPNNRVSVNGTALGFYKCTYTIDGGVLAHTIKHINTYVAYYNKELNILVVDNKSKKPQITKVRNYIRSAKPEGCTTVLFGDVNNFKQFCKSTTEQKLSMLRIYITTQSTTNWGDAYHANN